MNALIDELNKKNSYDVIGNIKSACEKKGYWFPKNNVPYNLFVFGIRNDNINQSKDEFDDIIGIVYPDKHNEYNIKMFQGTTDPGKISLTDPVFYEAIKGGTAIMVPGQYRSAYTLGTMGTGNWKHNALLQIKPVKVYRDKNKNEILDLNPETITEGMYGINIHAASLISDIKNVGRYSAGCQVIRSAKNHAEFIDLIMLQMKSGLGMIVSYTLFDKHDLL